MNWYFDNDAVKGFASSRLNFDTVYTEMFFYYTHLNGVIIIRNCYLLQNISHKHII